MTTSRQLMRAAEAAEIRLVAANQSAHDATASLRADFKRNAPWLVPALGVAAGLVLARTPAPLRNRLLTHGLPMLGGGLFSLINPWLRRLK